MCSDLHRHSVKEVIDLDYPGKISKDYPWLVGSVNRLICVAYVTNCMTCLYGIRQLESIASCLVIDLIDVVDIKWRNLGIADLDLR